MYEYPDLDPPTQGGPTAAPVVLIADEDPELCRLLGLVLARQGFQAASAHSAAGLFSAARANPPDVVLLSRQLPDGGSFDLIGHLRDGVPWVQVIALSIDPTAPAAMDAIDRGAFDLIVKPITSVELVARRIQLAAITARALRDHDAVLQQLGQREEAIRVMGAQLEQSRQAVLRGSTPPENGAGGLAGISSETAIVELVRKEAARAMRYQRQLCVVACRIDGLDAVMRRYGPPAAQEAMRGVAALTNAAIREVDALGRDGDDAFLFLLPETSKANGLTVAIRLQNLIASTPVLTAETTDGAPLAMTVSFGVAALPTDSMNAEGLVDRARTALQQGCSRGTSQITAFGQPN